MKSKYKYPFLLFSLLLAFSFTLRAQNNNRFEAGLKIGVNGSQIDGDGYTGWDKAGLNLGVFARTDFSEKWGMQFDLLYSQKGSRDPQDADNNKFNYYLIRLDYVEVPVLAQYSFSRFRAEFGPTFGVLVNSYEENENGEIPVSAFDFKPFELGYTLGGYMDITERFFLNIRYNRSFLPVSNEFRFLQAQFGFFGGSYNSSFSFAVGFNF